VLSAKESLNYCEVSGLAFVILSFSFTFEYLSYLLHIFGSSLYNHSSVNVQLVCVCYCDASFIKLAVLL